MVSKFVLNLTRYAFASFVSETTPTEIKLNAYPLLYLNKFLSFTATVKSLSNRASP